MSRTKRLLVENVAWANELAQVDAGFFSTLAQGQSPGVLWIGCSDSRVPAEAITNAGPGELFVHRNIANLVPTDDANTMSVLEYAVGVLRVAHVIICGHSGCGGVRAALAGVPDGMPHLTRRIAPLCMLAHGHLAELGTLPEAARADRLAELSVLEQVRQVRATALVRHAEPRPRVHGWMFDLHSGRLRVLDDEDAADGANGPAALQAA
ncbi:carbonic anhydrase [Ideonella azotifigens]|uniref:Carbonic anhydrase n=1 Tax=Ideonella azotifigens TaxID=513160 RepID=A0ABP3VQ12_9BURK|nr:carbonic anhydrase [Ideonella azotifigens]MCD2340483.1 carbonic anhydrase [Ideonella azotifigens]